MVGAARTTAPLRVSLARRNPGEGRSDPQDRNFLCSGRSPARATHDAVRPRRRALYRPGLPTDARLPQAGHPARSEEHTSELQSLMRISYAVFCLKKKKKNNANDRHILLSYEQYNRRTNTTKYQ